MLGRRVGVGKRMILWIGVWGVGKGMGMLDRRVGFWKMNGDVGSACGVLEREWGCWIGGWGFEK